MNEIENQLEAEQNYHAENAKKNSRLIEKLKLHRELNAAMVANSILRSALCDIIELEAGKHPATAIHLLAENALTESALDKTSNHF